MALKEPSERVMGFVYHAMERFRVRLKALNGAPFLQYVVIFDVKELSMQNMVCGNALHMSVLLTVKSP